MNIANIFGLHLGCKIKFNSGVPLIAKIKGVCEYVITEGSFEHYVNFDKCKLLLKPLSAISDEDKAELEKQLDDYDCEIQLVGAIVSIISEGKQMVELGVPNKTALWLCSKGYDIGIVPDEYKEVEE